MRSRFGKLLPLVLLLMGAGALAVVSMAETSSLVTTHAALLHSG